MKKIILISVSLLIVLGAMSLKAQIITTFAGNGINGFSGDGGLATLAKIGSKTNGIALDKYGNLYIADGYNQRIRKVNAITGIITTIAGTGVSGFTGDGGSATLAKFSTPTGITLDTFGNIYIADRHNHRIRKITVSTGIITTIAGWVGSTLDSGSCTCNGISATSGTLDNPMGLALDSVGNIYIANYNRVYKVVASSGNIYPIAGMIPLIGSYSGDGGPATSAHFNYLSDVALDNHGNLYIADAGNNRIRKVVLSTGIVTTFAGNGTAGYSGDGGLATTAEISYPVGLSVDSIGNVYFADAGNNRIRKINISSGYISTIAGNGTAGYSGDGGSPTLAELNHPSRVITDVLGHVYISDSYDSYGYLSGTGNCRIRKVTAPTCIDSITLVKDTTYADQIVTGYQTHEKVGSWMITNQSCSDTLKVTKLITGVVSTGGFNYFTDIDVCVSGISLCPGLTSGQIPMTNVTSTAIIIPPLSHTTIDIYASFSPDSSPGFKVSLKATVQFISTLTTISSGIVNGQNIGF